MRSWWAYGDRVKLIFQLDSRPIQIDSRPNYLRMYTQSTNSQSLTKPTTISEHKMLSMGLLKLGAEQGPEFSLSDGNSIRTNPPRHYPKIGPALLMSSRRSFIWTLH